MWVQDRGDRGGHREKAMRSRAGRIERDTRVPESQTHTDIGRQRGKGAPGEASERHSKSQESRRGQAGTGKDRKADQSRRAA